MHIEAVQEFCLTLPQATQDLKWGSDLCFMLGEKMFCMASLEEKYTLAFKVPATEFEVIAAEPGFRPAPYFARANWVMLEDVSTINPVRLKGLLQQSYELVKAKLPKKKLQDL